MTARQYVLQKLVPSSAYQPDEAVRDEGYWKEHVRLMGKDEAAYAQIVANQVEIDAATDYPYSSDRFLNQVMKSLLDSLPYKVRQQAKKVYVLKTVKRAPNAFAFSRTGRDYSGYIVEYWTGASRLMHLVAHCFAAYVAVKEDMWERPQENRMVKHSLSPMQAMLQCADLTTYLLAHVSSFRQTGTWNQSPELETIPALDAPFLRVADHIFYQMTSFILAHEVGHHLLNHTSIGSAHPLLHVGNYDGHSESHRFEFQADEFAGNCMMSRESFTKDSFYPVLGSYLCIIALSLMGAESLHTSSHPSPESRLIHLFRNVCQRQGDDKSRFITYAVNFIRYLFLNLSTTQRVENWRELAAEVFSRIKPEELDVPMTQRKAWVETLEKDPALQGAGFVYREVDRL